MTQELTPEQTTQRLISAISAVFGSDIKNNTEKVIHSLLAYTVDLLNKDENLIHKTSPDIWRQLSAFTQKLKFNWIEESELVNKLHEKHIHPDYEYEGIESGRKKGDGEPPAGHGWETNWLFHTDGQRYEDHERDDYTDTAWWRRLKEDAKLDEVDPFDHKRPKITLEPINLHVVLLLLAKRLNSSYFPVPSILDDPYAINLMIKTIADINELTKLKARPEFNSKPNYIEHGRFLNRLEPGVNKFQPSTLNNHFDDWRDITTVGDTVVKCNPESLYAYIELKETDILVDLIDPFRNSFVRINLKGIDKRAPFRQWVHFATIPINPFELEDAITVVF